MKFTDCKYYLIDLDGVILDTSYDNYFWQEYIPRVYAKKNNISHTEEELINFTSNIYNFSKDDFNGLHLAREIETNIFSRLSKIDNSNRFENSIGHNSILNELETELYKTIENLENPEYNNLFSLDKVLLQLSYKISSKNIIYNLNYLKTILSNERCFSYQRLNSNNIIAKKYIEISKMLLSILNPKEKKLINLRYGLDADRRHTLFDIYEMNKYKNYKELFEELTRALWKLKICWPNQILYKLLFCCEEEYEEEDDDWHEDTMEYLNVPLSLYCHQCSIKKVKKHRQTRARHPVDALQIVLFAFATDGGSSSGVEQGFSKTMATISSQQLKASEGLEEDLTKLVVDYAHIEDKAILRLAQEVWRDEFGSARKSPAEPRFDMGCPRAKQPGSETQWLQRRRESIIEGAASSGASSLDALSLDAIVVSEKQEEEIEFNKQKLLKKRPPHSAAGLFCRTKPTTQ